MEWLGRLGGVWEIGSSLCGAASVLSMRVREQVRNGLLTARQDLCVAARLGHASPRNPDPGRWFWHHRWREHLCNCQTFPVQ